MSTKLDKIDILALSLFQTLVHHSMVHAEPTVVALRHGFFEYLRNVGLTDEAEAIISREDERIFRAVHTDPRPIAKAMLKKASGGKN
jgi:hypothetical protein